MANVLQLDCTSNSGTVDLDLTFAPYAGAVPEIWAEFDVAFNAAYITAATASAFSQIIFEARDSNNKVFQTALLRDGLGGFTIDTFLQGAAYPLVPEFAPTPTITSNQFYHFKIHILSDPTTPTVDIWKDGALVGSFTGTGNSVDVALVRLRQNGMAAPGALQFYDNFTLGTTSGASNLLADSFEGTLAAWNGGTSDATIVADPGITPAVSSGGGASGGVGRVFIAFDDGPLVASPTWTRIDGGDSPFPQNFVSGYDIETGRQTLISQTDTGTATVYINDHKTALFDPRNVSSPYFGKLDGKQILLQLYDPVRAVWEDQFRGWINDITWDIDGSAVDANGDPINASIQIECVDVFDYLAGYLLTPGLDGVYPLGTAGGAPSGGEDGVWYAETSGTVDDRMIQVLTDVGIDPDRYVVASGNVHARAQKYDPGESALQPLRDAADADLPFIANIGVDRHGRFVFHGRYSRFYPDLVSAERRSRWDFQRWSVGDGKAIAADASRAQMRVLSYARERSELINWAIAYQKGLKPADMPSQVFADAASILAFGQHGAPPMSELLLTDGSQPTTGDDGNTECLHYAELLVKNKKDPREAISALKVKTVHPDDGRAAATWAMLSQADLNDIVNVKVGYPAGTGLAGDSPKDDYYIEGRRVQVRPLAPGAPGYDYVEIDYEVTPAVWSMDTHGVFDNPFAT